MARERGVTREIGNLRGFSTDNSFVRPPNVAEIAKNIQRGPDTSLQLRRGYQCQIAQIGGLGNGTFDNPVTETVEAVTLGFDGQIYKRITSQIFFYYNGEITKPIQNITQSNPAIVQSNGHGLPTGAVIYLENIGGMLPLNNTVQTITFVDPNHFSLNGVDSTLYPAYTSGGDWIVNFTRRRYLIMTIFTDPAGVAAVASQSITCDVTVNAAAQVNGNQTSVNTINVFFGSELETGDVVQFIDSSGNLQQRTLTGFTTTSITFGGSPVSVKDQTYIAQFIEIKFGIGFDEIAPYLISDFISALTNPATGVFGLGIAANGPTNLPAAFLEIFEPRIVDNNSEFSLDYWHWLLINHTVPTPFPGSQNSKNQNSQEFENASMAAFNDVIYICNGFDFPQKYDGQTVYRAGMPKGLRPDAADDTTAPIKPFVTGNVYNYAITYEQVDAMGNIAEGTISDLRQHTVVAANAAIDVTVENIPPNSGWNTNEAIVSSNVVTVYGPDVNGNYYDLIHVSPGYTLKIGDTAFYQDRGAAVVNGNQVNVNDIVVNSGFSVVVGDLVVFVDSGNVKRFRLVTGIDSTHIIIAGAPVSVNNLTNISTNKTGLVYGDVAIVNGTQANVNTINVVVGYTIQNGDVVDFVDAQGNLQRRTITAIGAGTITVSGIPVSVTDKVLIYAENMSPTAINVQRQNPNAAVVAVLDPISNNLRINIYRTQQGLSNTSDLQLLAILPNDASGNATQTYIDEITDFELGRSFSDPVRQPDPPPISKYVLEFGNQVLYGGGQVGIAENSDNVFFSEGNLPESVPAATNFFSVPGSDDDVSGLGVAGTTLIVTKTSSVWAITGDLLTGQFQVTQIAPGTNIGCIANATIKSVGSLLYFLHTNGVYAITENQFFPTDEFGNPVPISRPIDQIFRVTNFLPQQRYVLKRAVAINYTKDRQYLLFLPCEDQSSSIRTANLNSIILCYDYEGKNWFTWDNMNAAGGMFIIQDDLYFQERRLSGVNGNTAGLYKQHRFYRLIDHADHAAPQRIEWRSSWTDLGQPEVRKKFSHCVLLMDRISELRQFNNPIMTFSSYVDRIPNLISTQANVTTVDNVRNSAWGSPWGWGRWSGYQDSFVRINLKGGTVAKALQIGFTMFGINMDILFAGYQIEIIPENRKTVTR